MFATVLYDVYRHEEAKDLASALLDLCDPAQDNFGWGAVAVYLFWSALDRQPLYIGFTSNVHKRFCQHNGLVQCKENCCKRVQIASFFQNHPRLGFSILVASPHVSIAKTPKTWKQEVRNRTAVNKSDVTRVEATLIRTCEQQTGLKPEWNSIGSNVEAQELALPRDFKLVEVLTGRIPSFHVARASIRELSNDTQSEGFEEHLHAQRLEMMIGRRKPMEFGLDSRYGRDSISEVLGRDIDSYLHRPARVLA